MLAEDHQLVAAAMQALLSEEPRIEVIGCAGDGAEAIALVKQKKPDVLLLDLQLPGLHGLDVLREVNALTRVCVVSMHDDEHHILQAIKGGAMGYVCKSAAAMNLREGIHALAQGETYLCTESQKAALRSGRALFVPNKNDLTRREMEVLRLAALGKTNSEIAVELRISRRTAEAHRSSLMKKLALTNQTDLVLYALRSRMIALDGLSVANGGIMEAKADI